jgi:hypothetical protein
MIPFSTIPSIEDLLLSLLTVSRHVLIMLFFSPYEDVEVAFEEALDTFDIIV